MSGIRSLGRFAEPAQLPAPWGTTEYLLSHHGDSQVLAAWETADAFLALIDGVSRPVPGLLGLGDADGVARLLSSREVAEAISNPGADDGASGSPVRWATVPQGTSQRCPEVFAGPLAHLGDRGEWEWMWVGTHLLGADPEGVERLEPSAAVIAEVSDFLAAAHPTSDTDPDDPRIFGWWVVREGRALRAGVGAMRLAAGLPPYLVSLGVHPEHRGRGLADKVLAAAVRDGLAEPARVGSGVSLALYSANTRARRVYDRLGFELHHRFESLRAR